MRYYDNTRLKAYKTCPRFFYLRHERDFTKEGGLAYPLIFGLSWHMAQDVVWSKAHSDISDDELAKQAYVAFVRCWLEQGGKMPDDYDMDELEQMAPRTPLVGAEMLYSYIQERRDFIRAGIVLAVEQPFIVPLYEDPAGPMYIGRLDKVFRHPTEGIINIEHKTTSAYAKATGFRKDYLDSWSPDSQIDGYSHAARFLYGDEFRGTWVDAALVHKTVHDVFKFIPIDRRIEQLNSWLLEARDWADRIERDRGAFEFDPAWPKNTESCNLYGRPCVFKDICRFSVNPFSEEIPAGYVQDHWDPFEILEIGKLGLSNEEASDKP